MESGPFYLGTSEDPIRLRLFVAGGKSPRSRRAIENLERILSDLQGPPCELEVIDVLASPESAASEGILATPTLIKSSPPPQRRVTGDLSDSKKVLRAIGQLRDDLRNPAA